MLIIGGGDDILLPVAVHIVDDSSHGHIAGDGVVDWRLEAAIRVSQHHADVGTGGVIVVYYQQVTVSVAVEIACC